MISYLATYDNGKIIFDEKPKIKKSKVKIIFLDIPTTTSTRVVFPTEELGQIKNIYREMLYGNYMSD